MEMVFEWMLTEPVTDCSFLSSEGLTDASVIFSAFTLKLPFSTSLPLSSIMFILTFGVLTLMPAPGWVCRLPSPSAVATLMLSATMAIEAPVGLFLKSSPVLMAPFSASKAFFWRFTSAWRDTRWINCKVD